MDFRALAHAVAAPNIDLSFVRHGQEVASLGRKRDNFGLRQAGHAVVAVKLAVLVLPPPEEKSITGHC
jgi:hypothetical protein